MIANLMRWTWAILVPPLIMALIVGATEEGSVELLVLFVVGTVAVGTLPLALAQWKPANRAVVIIAYAIAMGFAVFITAILSACFSHGCH